MSSFEPAYDTKCGGVVLIDFDVPKLGVPADQVEIVETTEDLGGLFQGLLIVAVVDWVGKSLVKLVSVQDLLGLDETVALKR